MRDAIWVVSSAARPHICSLGCAHFSLRSASAPGMHSKGTALGIKVHCGERWPSLCPEGRLLLGPPPWTPWNKEFPYEDDSPDFSPSRILKKDLWFIWGLLCVFSGAQCMWWVVEDEDGVMGFIWSKELHSWASTQEIYADLQLSLFLVGFCQLTCCCLFVFFCFLFFLVVAYNVFMSVLPVTYSDFHPGGCYQSEFSAETETASFNWGAANAILDKPHNPRDLA